MSDEEIAAELRDLGRRLLALQSAFANRERERHEDAQHAAGPAPDFQALTHTVALDPDDVELIERCGE